MKKLTFSLLFVFFISSVTTAQVAINADGASANPKAMLDIKSSTKGLLIPRMNYTNRRDFFNTLSSTDIGMLVFDTDYRAYFVFTDGWPNKVVKLMSDADLVSLLEDEDGDTKIEVEKTADEDTIRFSIGGSEAFKMSRYGRLEVLNSRSISIGEKAGGASGSGLYNLAVGNRSMFSTISGAWNTTLGHQTLFENTEGYSNTAIGYLSMMNNTLGNENTAVGRRSLYSNTIGTNNCSMGFQSLHTNTIGTNNTAIGYQSLFTNDEGINNTAIGMMALHLNSSGDYNIALGYKALLNATGDGNIAIGANAGDNIRTGSNNIIIGKDLDAPSATASNQMYLGGAIYGYLSTGDIGIGTTSPSARLHVYDDWNCKTIIESESGPAELRIKTSGDVNDPSITFYNGTNVKGSIRYDIGENYMRIFSGGEYAFNAGKLGIGTTSPDGKLHVKSSASVLSIIESTGGDADLQIKSESTIENSTVTFYNDGYKGAVGYAPNGDYMFIYKGGNIAFKNGGIGIGTLDPQCALQINGQIWPTTHKGGTIGKTTLAWGNIYSDNFINVGAAAFTDRSVTDEILKFPPIAKKEGDFDYMTEKGLEELDPNYLPAALEKDDGILMDEMTTYNYKVNYEQQLQIEELKDLVEQLIKENKSLHKKVKRIEKRGRK